VGLVEVQWKSSGILGAERNIEDNIIIEQNSSGVHWSLLESVEQRKVLPYLICEKIYDSGLK